MNNDKCQCECKKIHVCETDYMWNPAPNSCENIKYLATIMNKIICDKIMKVKETNFNKKNITCKTQSFYIFPISHH